MPHHHIPESRAAPFSAPRPRAAHPALPAGRRAGATASPLPAHLTLPTRLPWPQPAPSAPMGTGHHTGGGRTEALGSTASGWTWGSLAPFAGRHVHHLGRDQGGSPPPNAIEISTLVVYSARGERKIERRQRKRREGVGAPAETGWRTRTARKTGIATRTGPSSESLSLFRWGEDCRYGAGTGGCGRARLHFGHLRDQRSIG